MNVFFRSGKLKKECEDFRLLVKRHGDQRAQRIRRRLGELKAARTLEDMRTLPQARCHELRQNRADQISVDLDQPYRLILEPAHDPVPRRPDGGLDWSAVTSIRILDIEDTHE